MDTMSLECFGELHCFIFQEICSVHVIVCGCLAIMFVVVFIVIIIIIIIIMANKQNVIHVRTIVLRAAISLAQFLP